MFFRECEQADARRRKEFVLDVRAAVWAEKEHYINHVKALEGGEADGAAED